MQSFPTGRSNADKGQHWRSRTAVLSPKVVGKQCKNRIYLFLTSERSSIDGMGLFNKSEEKAKETHQNKQGREGKYTIGQMAIRKTKLVKISLRQVDRRLSWYDQKGFTSINEHQYFFDNSARWNYLLPLRLYLHHNLPSFLTPTKDYYLLLVPSCLPCRWVAYKCIMTGVRSSQLAFLQEGYSKAAMLLASERHAEAETLMGDLMQRVQALRARGDETGQQGELRKAEAQCCVNLASTLLNRQDCEDSFLRIRQLLQRAISLDCLSHWAYFNLASYLFRTSNYAEALRSLHCALSCLYLLKAVLSRDLQNRNREIDLGRAITFAPNNLQARYVRLLMQVKQGRWKMAANEAELALEVQPQGEHIILLRDHLLSLAGSPAPHPPDARSALRKCIELVASIPPQQTKLQGAEGTQGQRGAVVKEIQDRMVQFNQIFRQVNELGSTQNLFLMKALHRTARSDKRIHIISNSILPSSPPAQEQRMSESMPYRPSVELEAKTIERVNDSKNCLSESKGYGESLFEITKSQNLQNSKQVLPGSLLSSIPLKHILPSEVREVDNQNDTLSGSGPVHRAMDIQAIQSEIQPLPENESVLISADPKVPTHSPFEQDDLLLDSLYDRDFKKSKPADLPKTSRSKEEAGSLYPLQGARVVQLTLLKAEMREQVRQKLVGIYAMLEYNSGLIETYKFRSRQVGGSASEVDWSESLGFIRLAEQPKSMVVKLFKSEPYYYNDKFLGEGEIEVTALGIIKIPLYLNMRGVGTVSVRLVAGQQGQGLYSSFKRSVTSNSIYSSSLNSESHSQH